DFLMGEMGVGEDDLIHPLFPEKLGMPSPVDAGYTVWIEVAGESRPGGAIGDPGDLRGGEGHHPGLGIVTEDGVEVVEVPASSSHDHYASHPAPYCAGPRLAGRPAPRQGRRSRTAGPVGGVGVRAGGWGGSQGRW